MADKLLSAVLGFDLASLTRSNTFLGTNTFTNQVELTGQLATNPTSALNKALGDARYPSKTFVNITEYGAISGQLCDAAIASAITAAVTAGHRTVYFPAGDWWINVPIAVSHTSLRFIGGPNARIIQTTDNHGIELSGINGAARDFGINGVDIVGPGWELGKSGIKWANGATYIGDTLTVENCRITEFGHALELGNVNKIYARNLSSIQCKHGAKLTGTQTWMFTDCRMVGLSGSGAMAGSSCYEISGDIFAGYVVGGEYGGVNVERFANIPSGTVYVLNANLESFSSAQTISMPGLSNTKRLILRNCRISVSYAATSSIISCEVDDFNGAPVLEISGIHGVAGTPRFIEVYGNYTIGGSVNLSSGGAVPVSYTATQGGTIAHSLLLRPSVRNYFEIGYFPAADPGSMIFYSSPTDTNQDRGCTNLLFRRRNNHTGTNQWSSVVNDMLIRVLGMSNRIASGNNVETDIQNVTLPAGVLRNHGESVEIELFGSTAANANNKQFRFYFGGTQYFDFGALPINNQSWHLRIIIQRGAFAGGTGFMKLLGVLDYGIGKVIKTAETPNATIDSSATIATRVTVLTPSAASDAVSLAAKTTWLRAPQAF